MNKENNPGTPLWRALLLEHRWPWRYIYNDLWPWVMQGIKLRFIDYILYRNINKFLLRLNSLSKYKKEDITVIIGVKNIYDDRIINALKSIRNQDYPQNLIKITVVDYDSKKTLISKFKRVCKKYNAEYIRVNNQMVWSRSHCLNIGIKKAKTKYLLTSDVDIIFEKKYISEAVKELRRNPYQIILSICLMLPNISINKLDFKKLKKIAKPRQGENVMTRKPLTDQEKIVAKGISLTLTKFYQDIGGYDEQFRVCGFEDTDLMKRLMKYGLTIKDISSKTFYLHQWHPMYQKIKKIKNYHKAIEKNLQYMRDNYSIIRNKDDWGEIR